MPKLKKNILNFRYGANFKYEGMLTHSFDRFYIIAKMKYPRWSIWPNYKRIICTYNNNIPVSIPSHLYVLLDRNILCNFDIKVESNFFLESLAACNEHEKPELEMIFMVNLAFMDYLAQLNVTYQQKLDEC